MTKSNSEQVREFNIAADVPAPNTPSKMTPDEVEFLTKMIIDETLEFLATIKHPSDAKLTMIKLITDAKDVPKIADNAKDVEIIAEQADALVDINYYCENIAVKKGINLSSVFDEVHQANMNKRDPKTGKFKKREDGKIMKPDGWIAPNITKVIQKQIDHGSFV